LRKAPDRRVIFEIHVRTSMKVPPSPAQSVRRQKMFKIIFYGMI
jgi:hypothetical protein